VTRFLAVLAAACVVAGCGGGSKSDQPRPTRFGASEQAYVNRLQALCAGATDSPDGFRKYVDALGRLQPPPSLAAQHRQRLATERRAGIAAAYGRDDSLDARLGLVDCIWPPGTTAQAAYPTKRAGTLAALRPSLGRICADNTARTARARTLVAGDPQLDSSAQADARWRIAVTSTERLARLVRRLGSPKGAGPDYGAWLDATRTAANFTRLASDAYFAGDEGRADALSAQAARTAKAAQRTARRLGLTACATGDAAATTG
jgi:hypothetical protein